MNEEEIQFIKHIDEGIAAAMEQGDAKAFLILEEMHEKIQKELNKWTPKLS